MVTWVSNYEEVISVAKSQISNTGSYTTFTFCISPSQDRDRILFFPYRTTLATSADHQWIVLDDISITEFDPNFAGNDLTLCSEDYTLGPDCAIPGASYTWTPTTGLSDPTIHNPIATPNSQTTYTLNITLPGTTNCSLTLTDQVTVNSVLPSGTVIIPDGADLSYFVNNGLGTYMIPFIGVPLTYVVEHKSFLVEGELIFDNSGISGTTFGVLFRDNTFTMKEGSVISIPNGAELTNVNQNNVFTTCSNSYWEGFSIKSDARFYGPIKIERANLGMQIENTGNGNAFTIHDVEFKDNKQGIQIVNFNQGTTSIKDATFISTTHPSAAGSFYPSKSIEARDNTGSIVIEQSDFDGSAGAIVVENSELEIKNNSFEGFNNQFTFPGSPEKTEFAIRLVGDQLNTMKARIDGNYFLNVKEGIIGNDDYETVVINNFYHEDDLGNKLSRIPGSFFIKIHDNAKAIEIKDNNIYNVDAAIRATNIIDLDITGNFIDLEYQGNYTSYTNKVNNYSVGILAGHYSMFHPASSVLIDNNEIWHSKVGIQTEFLTATISNNEVLDMNNNMNVNSPCDPYPTPCPTSTPYGIRAMNEYANIFSNKVKNNSALYSTPPENDLQIVGISLENTGTSPSAFSSIVECNNVENTGVGLRFSGNQGTDIEIQFNRMKMHARGLELANGGVIGDIGALGAAADNTWEYSSASNRKHTFANQSFGGNSTIYTQSGGFYEPSIDANNDFTFGFSAFNLNVGNAPASANCTAPALMGSNGNESKNSLNQNKSLNRGKASMISRGSRRANDSLKILDKQLLYFHLLRDSTERNKAAIRAFVDSMKLTSMQQLVLQDSSTTSGQTIQDLKLNSFFLNMRRLKGKDIRSYQAYRRIYQLAQECPYEHGLAVYLARGIVEERSGMILINDCEKSRNATNSSQLRLGNNSTSAIQSFHVFPNPAESHFFIKYLVEEDMSVELELMNLLGKTVLKDQIANGETYKINRQELPSGIYIIKIVSNDQEIFTEKIIFK